MLNNAVYILENRKMAFRPAGMPLTGACDVLIKMKYCGVCGSDVHFYEHCEPEFPDVYPFMLGHEGAGEVVEPVRM
jgi:L-iditol 2-dehydrogenase